MFGSTNRDVDVASLKNTLLVCNNKSAARKTTPLPHMPYLPFLNKASIHFKNAKAFIAHYRALNQAWHRSFLQFWSCDKSFTVL